ncbi:aldolase [Massilia sp. WF1]|uniref:class II aldolase/adducin family protein n=1 Tax=unclassified Massilia TaxID=2609279 RepID=UPI00064AD098|nr:MULTISPECIES: class II aldolase/adducin family protein [unclassified Massilia]ALK97575.1 class II aldolase [Massilia sp. WG5]KLU35968.1 aldolase [Massilia sp. WF1]
MSPAVHTTPEETRQREQMVEFGRSLFERGLSAGSSGNISVRLDDGWLLTPTNASLGPSKEAFLHRAMYQQRPGAGAIVHLHATHSAAVSCMCGLNQEDCIPPLTPYFVMKIGRLPLVPYHRPGDPALAGAIGALARRHAALLLANHGPVVSGASLEAAVYAAEELEETAKLFLLLRGVESRPLDAAQIGELKSVYGLDL